MLKTVSIFELNDLDLHIAKIIKLYPAVFSNRVQVLHTLFCDPNNGHHWEGGVLIDPCAPEESELALQDEGAGEAEIRPGLGRSQLQRAAEFLCSIRAYNQQVNFNYNNAELLALIAKPLNSICPLESLSAMATVPDDIHPDYLTGIREMIIWIFNTPPTLSYNSEQESYDAHTALDNLLFADRILQELEARFGKPAPEFPGSYKEYIQRKTGAIVPMF